MKRRRCRAGMCQLCGCTYWRPCPGGCAWANADATLCTRCADAVTWAVAVLLYRRDV